MPIYPVRCECGFAGDVYAKSSQADKLECPQCESKVEQDWGEKLRTVQKMSREFHGDRRWSLTEGFHSSQVGEARRELGDMGRCVDDKGHVWFNDRAEQQRYVAAKADWELRKRDKLASSSSTPDKV